MASQIGKQLLVAWAIAASIQLVLWLISLRSKNAGIVDVGWALSFTPIVGYFAWRSELPVLPVALIAGVVTAWSVRLGGYLLLRGAAHGPEEGRYRHLRERWQPHADRSFLVFFQVQALLSALLSIAFVVPISISPRDGSVAALSSWLWIGLAVSALGIIGESLADGQLAAFKKTAAREAVCNVGLWSWSRHPNYFFESMYWAGWGIVGVGYAHGYIAWASCVLLTVSIFRVTGIPATEAQALRSKGEAYRAYQRRTSVFFPWPPTKE